MKNPVSFADLGLSSEALETLVKNRFTKPTPIQIQSIPVVLAGHDLIGCAATGTGKTAAFALPILDKLAGTLGRAETRALVLAPTRELALQIAGEFERFGATRNIRCVTLIGGASMRPQIDALRRNPPIVVATPGRLVDHLRQGHAQLNTIRFLVLDEADRMLDMGFKKQLDQVLVKLPRQRQTLLFSATLSGDVASFAEKALKNPTRVEVVRSGTLAERAEQRVYRIPQSQKTALLLALLADDQLSTLVFTRTKRRADKLARSLDEGGHSVGVLHADRSQGQRKQALEGFRKGRHRILVATDIAARGIDVVGIGQVVNYELPQTAEDYVHRVGRTARAELTGRAIALVAPEEMQQLRRIEKLTRTDLPVVDVPRDSEVFKEALAKQHAAQKDPGPSQKEGGQRRHHGRSGRSGHPDQVRKNNSSRPSGSGSPKHRRGGRPPQAAARARP